MMNRQQFKKNLQEGLNTTFGLEYDRYPEEWRVAYEINNSDKAYEEDTLMVGLGPGQVKPEGRGVAYDEGAEAWTARYVHETIALAFAITEEAIEDGLYGNLGARYSKAMARSMQYTKNVKGANIFNNAFSASFLFGDGKSLLATDHPLAGGGTWANTFATHSDLAEASLEDMLNLQAAAVDERGLPVVIRSRKLLIHPNNQFVADRLLNSPARPGTSDNDLNSISNQGMIPGGFGLNHHFTDPVRWFLTTDCPDGLKHFVRKAISRGMEGDFETGNLRYKSRERYSFGCTNPRGVYGS